MPNKNSIESEIREVFHQNGLNYSELTEGDELIRSYVSMSLEGFNATLETLAKWHQREVKKGRVEELKRNAYYSQPRKTDPLKLCGIDMTAKQVLDRLEELENDS